MRGVELGSRSRPPGGPRTRGGHREARADVDDRRWAAPLWQTRRGMTTRLGPGVVEIDTLLGGWTRVTAGYLIEGPAPVLVETGSQTSVPVLLEALAAHGLGP